MSEDRDDMPPTTADLQWEQDRSATLRTFKVVLFDGAVEHVLAHYWSNENPAGHLNFYTMQPSGRTLILRSFSFGYWARLAETTPHETAVDIDRIARRQKLQQAGQRAMDGHRQSSRRIH